MPGGPSVAARAIAAKDLSPVELVKALIERIAKLKITVGKVPSVAELRARQQEITATSLRAALTAKADEGAIRVFGENLRHVLAVGMSALWWASIHGEMSSPLGAIKATK